MGRLISSTSSTSGHVQGPENYPQVHVHASNPDFLVPPLPNVNSLLHFLGTGTLSLPPASNLLRPVGLQDAPVLSVQLLHVDLGYLDQMIWTVQDPSVTIPGPGPTGPSSSTLKTNKTRRPRNANNAQGRRGGWGRGDRKGVGRVRTGMGSTRGQAGCCAAGRAY
jgi:hypothetical protein